MKKKMIKNLLLVVVMAVLCVAVGMTASAEDRAIVDSGECGAEGDNVIWTFYDDGELVISGEGEMATFSGPRVSWWDYGNDIVSLTVKDGVTSIFWYPIKNLTNLINISLPDSLNNMDDCFRCIKNTAYYKDQNNWDNGVFYIDKYLVGALEDISGEYRIKDGTIFVNSGAFANYNGLSKITVPDSVSFIGEMAFVLCYNLEKIEVEPGNKNYSSDESGVLFNKDKTKLIFYPCGKKDTEYTLPETVKVIGSFSFYGLLDLEKINFNDGLEMFEYGALNACPSLTEIRIPSTVKMIDDVTFCYSMFIENIYIESKDVNFGEYVPLTTGNVRILVSREEFIELGKRYVNETDEEKRIQINTEISNSYIHIDGLDYPNIYCHYGSTAETYAIENNIPYFLTHFFEGEWTYDYDNMIRYRKCIHCDELETEALETTGDSDVEIIEPVDPDTDFVVDEITDYVIIEEALSNGVAGDFEIVKAFDITMTGKDGVHVQPDGTVKVKLPLDWSKDGVYKVYRVNDDGTLTDMNAYRQGSHMVFDTDHFSIYVIVDESEKTDAPATPDEPQEETKDNFFTKLLVLIKSFFDLIMSWFKK